MRRSKLLKARRFGDFLRSTLSWWRSAMISASREARDLKSPMTTHQISFSISPMRRSIARFAALRQWDKVYDKDNGLRGSPMNLRWCESPGDRIAALSADQAPTAIIGCPHMTMPGRQKLIGRHAFINARHFGSLPPASRLQRICPLLFSV